MKVDPAHINQLSKTMHMLYAQEPYMMRKVRTTVNINEELKQLAEEFGINLSAFLELKLFEHFRELILMKNAQNGMLRPGFEPGSRDRESSFAVLNYSEHKSELIDWFKRRISKETYKRYINFLDEMLANKIVSSPKELVDTLTEYEQRTGKRVERHRKIAIRNYLNFLVERGYYRKSQIIDYLPVLKLERTGIREAKKAFTTEEKIVQAHGYLKEKGDKKRLLIFYLMLFGGLRLSEACDILNNFRKGELQIKGRIARYDLLEMYKRLNSTKARAETTKRAWVAYMPSWVAEQLEKMEVKEDILRGKHFCNGIILPNMLRKWFSNFLKNDGVPERTIEFMTGKTSDSVLRQFYFELLEEADEWYAKIVDKFPIKEVKV